MSGASNEDDVSAKARIVGYRRLLDGIFARQPERLYELYDEVKNGHEPFCPEGFSADASEEWREFLKTEWFSSISADEKIRIDAIVGRRKTLPALIAQKEVQLAKKIEQIKKFDSMLAKVSRFFSSEKKSEFATLEHEREARKREIAELQLELQEFRVSQFIDEQIAETDAQQHSVGDRAGLGARALDASRRMFSWIFSQEKTHAPLSLRGKVFGGLSGLYFNVPSVVDRWMIEAASANAAGSLKKGSSTDVHNVAVRDLVDLQRAKFTEGRPEVDWAAYLFALQQRITAEIAQASIKSQPLKIAVEREPLKGMLKAYHDAVPRVAPVMRTQQERLTTIISQQLAQTEQDLRSRIGTRNVGHLVAGNDVPWIESILDEQEEVDASKPVLPSATPEHDAEREQLGLRYSFIVGAQETSAAAVRRMITKFDPTKSETMLNRDTLQFMTHGWVFEQGDTERRNFISASGREAVPLYVGDRLTAVQDAAAPMGFRIEIIPQAPPQHEGYSVTDSNGNPELYYQHAPNGTVHAWKVKEDGSVRLAGHFEGKKFVKYVEKSWGYVGKDGAHHTISEFKEEVFFKPDGTVVTRHAEGFTDLGKLPAPFAKSLTITKKDDSQEIVKLDATGHTYFVTPQSEVVEYHASAAVMRKLGTIKT